MIFRKRARTFRVLRAFGKAKADAAFRLGTGEAPCRFSVVLPEQAPTDLHRCVECLRDFPASEVMHLEYGPVCAGCKQMALAKLASGQPLGSFWRRGKTLLMVRNRGPMDLPDRCIVCNQPVGTDGVKSVTYWAPAFVLFFVLMPLVSLTVFIMYLVDRDRCRYSLCHAHWRQRWNGLWVQGVLQFGSLFVIFVAAEARLEWLLATGFLLFFAVVFIVFWGRGELREMWRTRNYFYLRGCGRAFLAEFPEWTGRR